MSITPSQTIGPFFAPVLIRPGLESMAQSTTRGDRVTIAGRVLDGDRAPVADALIELWQANAEGRYDHPEDTQEKLLDPHFHGFGRACSDADGWYRFHTIKPGAVPGANAVLQAPHLNVTIFARGLLNRLLTRIYFPGEPLNMHDSVLNAVPPTRRPTLIATACAPSPETTLRFDIVLQGEGETVFFSV
jgi:protocatechuate 3,4-dioxygenase alpha subunit